MLQLKKYQQRALDELKNFLINASTLKGERGIRLAYLDQVGDEERHYKPIQGLEQSPYLCIKIPTGGGKTLVACHTLNTILDNYLVDKSGKGLVMWFVPSDAIRSQTLKNLQDRRHPYRELLDAHFHNQVNIFTLEEALSIQKSDLQNNLCIVVASLQAFRRSDKAWLKVFQNNGSLISHFDNLIEDTDFLDKDEDGDLIYSLGNVIKINNPITILDEGHNVQTKLSYELLVSLNPSFILEFTATPRSESNVLTKVMASELKSEKMVNIPIYLSNTTQWQEAIREGVDQRNKLEKISIKEKKITKEYIRPIALLQAQPNKKSEEKVHILRVKEFLVDELKIPAEQIAEKTSTVDELKDLNLLSQDCKIRYVVTVNALKEGWDCPFAYVLVSVADIGSKLSVEQTIGRILRRPNTSDKKNIDLNYSFVFTSSESFSKASSAVISGLEANGFSRADLRENKGSISAEKTQYDRLVKDSSIKIPYMSMRSKKSALAFNRDLIGADFKIDTYYKPFSVDFHDDQNQLVKIDIDKENGIYRITQGKLMLVLYPEDFSLEEVASWLKRNIRHVAVSASEMSLYIDKAIQDLSKKYSVEELSLNRFRLKERINEEVQTLIDEHAKKQFDILISNGEIDCKSAYYEPEESLNISRLSPEHFQKHLFERSGYMNGEETDFAMRLDLLDDIEWWYRNREKEDFYLQGWRSNKFYPDYVIKTKSERYILAEYKGEDRLTNEDTEYKNQLGQLWMRLSEGKCKFYLVNKKEIESCLIQINNE